MDWLGGLEVYKVVKLLLKVARACVVLSWRRAPHLAHFIDQKKNLCWLFLLPLYSNEYEEYDRSVYLLQLIMTRE